MKLLDAFFNLFPRGIYYDNMGEKGQGVYITLTPANVEFCDEFVVIDNDEYLFFGVQMNYSQIQDIINNQFINGLIELERGHIEYQLEENLYRLYDEREENWIRVSRENLLSVLQSPKER